VALSLASLRRFPLYPPAPLREKCHAKQNRSDFVALTTRKNALGRKERDFRQKLREMDFLKNAITEPF
jgi:hypothetical protein